MKNSLIKIFFSIFISGFILTSCLGDNESSSEGTLFAYISETQAGMKFAFMDGLLITSDDIQNNTKTGSCYMISYKVTSNDPVPDNIIHGKTSSIELITSTTLLLNTPVPSIDENSKNPTTFDLTAWAGGDWASYYGYNWRLKYTYPIDGNYIIVPMVYYDDTNQKEPKEGDPETMIDIDTKKQVIIDVRFVAEEAKPGVAVTGKGLVVFNVKTLLDKFRPTSSLTEAQRVPVKIRYIERFNNNTPVYRYLGGWNVPTQGTTNSYYGFYYPKATN